MTRVLVSVPVYKGSRRFHLDKGRPWSVFDQIILYAVHAGTDTADGLATEAAVPRRLVLETLIRLMRAGWVNIIQDNDGIRFRATRSGAAVLEREELPSAPKRITRWMGFIIDRATGSIFRPRDLLLADPDTLTERTRQMPVVSVKPRDPEDGPEENAPLLVSTLLSDDEAFVSIEPSGERLVERYALIPVEDGKILAPSHKLSPALRKVILDAAKLAPAAAAGADSPIYTPPEPEPSASFDLEEFDAVVAPDDIIVGGENHRELLKALIDDARNRLIIHSTFISEKVFNDWWPSLEAAAKRGVVIDVMWGQEDDPQASTRRAIDAIRERIAQAGLTGVRVRAYSTRSHVKFVIADSKKDGNLTAVVGSCNWFASGYHSVEASVRLRHPKAVAAIIAEAAQLAKGGVGVWGELTDDLLRLQIYAATQPIPKGQAAKVAVLLGTQHASVMLRARNEATKTIFVASHRLGPAVRPAVLVPTMAAARDKVAVEVYYGKAGGGVTAREAADLAAWAEPEGVKLKATSFPRLHAKLLVWDEDSVVITSQNWLSADPGYSNPRREIGVYVRGVGLGRAAIEKFQKALEEKPPESE